MSDPKTIDITPTPEGLRRMKVMMEHSLKVYEEQLQIIADYLQEQEGVSRKTEEQFLYDSILIQVRDLKAQIEESMVSIKDGIAELKRCGY